MTVCTACICLWMYPDQQVGSAIITASDRMLSDSGLGIEYENSRLKALNVDDHHMIFVAGDLTFNSYALSRFVEWSATATELSTLHIAEAYGRIVSACAFERAVKRVLEPIGVPLNRVRSDGFRWQDTGLGDAILAQILDQLQGERVDCEAMVVGNDGNRSHLYRIDGQGVVTQHDDVGFLSIGSGGIHASGYYMQAPYNHVIGYHDALILTYFGKKRAEVAPGVGTQTDMWLLTGHAATPVSEFELKALQKAYGRSQQVQERLRPKLREMLVTASAQSADALAKLLISTSAEPDGG